MSSLPLIDRGACPLCGSTQASVHIPFPSIPVARCSGCEFLYSSRVFSPEATSAYYGERFGSERHRKGQQVNARVNATVLPALTDVAKVRTLLDVGSGYGYFLQEAQRRFGIQGTGIELSRREANFARRELGQHVLNTPLEGSDLPTDRFDLVTSFEVIEHVTDPIVFIATMTRYVRPGGHLLIMTDNFESNLARALGPDFPKWIPHSHVSHFSSQTLLRTIERIPQLSIEASRSFTPWETMLRNVVHRWRGRRTRAQDAFDLEATLRAEMGGEFRHFALRKTLNPIWARLALTEDMHGDLMFVLARRIR